MSNVPFDAASYRAQVNAQSPKSRTLLYCFRAFWTGGAICLVGQGVNDFLQLSLHLPDEARASAAAIVMVFLGALLTGLGVYDRIGAYAGAGSVVPITGFANSVVAPAMEFKPEGLVLGVAANMFKLAGPVLVYGVGGSVLVGLAYVILGAL